jgi:deoxycytidine triphosphate deaminase
MQYTGKQIVEAGIVSNYAENAVQQQGIDVRISALYRLSGVGYVPAQGKTSLPETSKIEPKDGSWLLDPGYYEAELMEGIKVPNNAALRFHTRSSLVRNGVLVHSGQFDAGFQTEKGGCFLQVLRPTIIDRGARIAQAIVTETAPVENTYEGQFQNDKQRK